MSIREKHNMEMGNYHFSQIPLDVKNEIDHRKMMCFFTRKSSFRGVIDTHNLEEFIDSICVNAVLIGSSNQSKATYFDKFASKGEADVFILRDTYYSPKEELEYPIVNVHQQEENLQIFSGFEDTVVTKSIFGRGHSQSQIFMNDILRDMLKTGLK